MSKMKVLIACAVVVFTFCQCVCDSKTPQIIRQNNEINPDGTYSYAYETENAIYREEQGFLSPDTETRNVQGQFQYESPEGEVIRLAYVADETGFHPQGEHLPTPPPTSATLL